MIATQSGNPSQPAPWPVHRSRRVALFSLLGIVVVLLFLELPGSWLIDPDESRYAEIPREMLASRDFVTPTLNGAHYFEKPPLYYWVTAASIAAFGHNTFAARLPARLAALGTAALLWVGLEGTAGVAGAGPWAALLFLTAPLVFGLGRYNIIDGLLGFTLTLAFFALRGFLCQRDSGGRALRQQIVFGAGMALAMLSKGLVGIVFPALVLLLWAAILGRWRRVRELLFSWAPLVFLVVAVPWFVLVERANPGFSRFFFVHEHLLRYSTSMASRPGPVYYFLLAFAAGFLPWTVLVWRALRPLLSRQREHLRQHQDDLFFALWLAAVLVFFSLSRSKLLPYILPAFPAAAALVARAIVYRRPGSWLWMAEVPSRTLRLGFRRPLLVHAALLTLAVPAGLVAGWRSAWLAHHDVAGLASAGGLALILGAWAAFGLSWRLGVRPERGIYAPPHVLMERRATARRRALLPAAAGWTGLFLVLVLALPRLSRDLSSHDLAVAAAGAGADQVVAYHCCPYNFPWELRHPIPVADHRDELGSDGELPAALYWSRETFWARWNSEERLVVVTRRRDLAEFARSAVRPPTRLMENETLALLANYAPGRAR